MAQNDLRARLVHTSSWMSVFQDNLDVAVSDALGQLSQSDFKRAFNSYHLDELIDSAIDLIDRIVVYRRDAIELDGLAIKYAAEHKLFLDTFDLDAEIQQKALGWEQASFQRSANESAVNEFRSAADPLGLGLACQSDGSAKAADITHRNETERSRLMREKADLVKAYRLELHRRHTLPGQALNFAERYTRVLNLLLEDVRYLYVQSLSLSRGVKAIYGIDWQVPAISPSNYIDTLLGWFRALSREVDLHRDREVQETLIATALQGSPLHGVPYMTAAEFGAAMASNGSGEVSFDLANDLPGQGHVRTLAVGIAFIFEMSDPSTRDNRRVFRATADVEAPKQRIVGQVGQSPSPIRVRIGGVGSLYQDKMITEEGVSIRNLDPRGIWKVRVQPWLIGPEIKPFPRRPPVLADIVLSIRIAKVSP
ncbi:MAG: hypothetical protein K2X25_08345 [Caulobacteraceae bacterium]|nr:hypothetical protein [Caulobacteraceae bacterium]